jgi:hypothetical protein
MIWHAFNVHHSAGSSGAKPIATLRKLRRMDRKEAERIVGRDLPGVIKKMLKGLPIKAPAGLDRQIYDSSFEGLVADLVDGSLQLGRDGRLTSQLLESTGKVAFQFTDAAGNITNL